MLKGRSRSRWRSGFIVAASLAIAIAPLGAPAAPLDPLLCTINDLGVLPTLPLDTDCDGDGVTPAQGDCNDRNPAIKPGAPDAPELTFTDTNCDGIDGDAAAAIFVAPSGDDAAAGTRTAPKKTLNAAIASASVAGFDVYVTDGTYAAAALMDDVSLYGSYTAGTWARAVSQQTIVTGAPEAMFADGDTGIALQLLEIRSIAPTTGSTYGLRAINGSSVSLEFVNVLAAPGAPAPGPGPVTPGVAGAQGLNGTQGSCDGSTPGTGGSGGSSPGWPGGKGGNGGPEGGAGFSGSPGAGPGGGSPGFPGSSGDPGGNGGNGGNGAPGSIGPHGSGGTGDAALASQIWTGRSGAPGSLGARGAGGGGGGGGGGQTCFFCNDGAGNGAGGGGAGGGGGGGGPGGAPGGGSFGIYLWNSTITIASGSVTAGNGATGGSGALGAPGGGGAPGGFGSTFCAGEIGRGGNGGFGGAGGQGGAGGGGAGGPSIALFKGGTSGSTLSGTTLATGAPGQGGTSPGGPAFAGAPGIAAATYP